MRGIALILLLICVAAAQVTAPLETETGQERIEQLATLGVQVRLDGPGSLPPARVRWRTHELVARVVVADIFRPPIG